MVETLITVGAEIVSNLLDKEFDVYGKKRAQTLEAVKLLERATNHSKFFIENDRHYYRGNYPPPQM